MTTDELIEELKKYPGKIVWIEGCDCDERAIEVQGDYSSTEILIKRARPY